MENPPKDYFFSDIPIKCKICESYVQELYPNICWVCKQVYDSYEIFLESRNSVIFSS